MEPISGCLLQWEGVMGVSYEKQRVLLHFADHFTLLCQADETLAKPSGDKGTSSPLNASPAPPLPRTTQPAGFLTLHVRDQEAATRFLVHPVLEGTAFLTSL